MLDLFQAVQRGLGGLGLALLLTLSAQAQSGWTRAQGEVFAQLNVGGFSTSQYSNLAGDQIETSRFRQGFISIYGEYGLRPRWTIVVNGPLVKAQGFETTETVVGLGDLMVGVTYGLLRGAFPVTLTLMPEFPTGPANLFAQNRLISFEQINLPTGDGEFNVHGLVAGSHSFYPAPVYVNAHLRYNLRTQYAGEPFQDQAGAGMEVGAQAWSRLWIRLRLTAQTSLGDAPRMVDFVRGEGTTFTAWGAGLGYPLTDHWGLDLSYQGYLNGPIPRRNLYNGQVLSLGLNFTWKPEEASP
jgi:hypothetical protein